MPAPTFDDILDEDESINDQNIPRLVNWATLGRAHSAYWQGRAEGLEVAMGHVKQANDGLIQQMTEAHELTIGYLKDRLNRLETPRATNS